MHDPPHPGTFIRRQCLEPLGLTVTEAAKGLAVSRNTLSMLLNGRLGISPAVRLPIHVAAEHDTVVYVTAHRIAAHAFQSQTDRRPDFVGPAQAEPL